MKNKTIRQKDININQNYSEISEDEYINLNLIVQERCDTNNKRIRENIFNMLEFEEDNSTECEKDIRKIMWITEYS